MYDIYLITNKLNGKKYVGLTKDGYKTRFLHHCSQGYYLTSSIKKHGRDNFSLELLLQVKNKEEAAQEEIRLIRELGSKFPLGYNFSDGGQTPCHTVEVKAKISANTKGKKKSKVDLIRKCKMKPLYCKELEVTFLSVRDAADFLGVNNGNFSRYIKQGRSVKNYTFEYIKGYII